MEVYNICRSQRYDSFTSTRKEEIEVYYCNYLVLYVKWYNIFFKGF